jgi:transposase-like protein
MSIEKLLWWSNGIYCMHCKSKNISFIEKRKFDTYDCLDCHKEFNVFTGTPFQKTKLTEAQWKIILKELRPDTKPHQLCKKVGIHHWSMSKLMTKIGKVMCRQIPEEKIKAFRENTETVCAQFDFKDNELKAFQVMLAFIYYAEDEATITLLTGLSRGFVEKCMDNVRKSWTKGNEFQDEDKKWDQYETFTEISISASLNILCMLGEIVRDPKTRMWSLPKSSSNQG